MPLLSAFTMSRNAGPLYFPAVESVRSALPIVDEFVVALGRGDPGDDTRARLCALGDPRIRIVDRTWDEARFRDGAVFAEETTFALRQCRSTWCLYLQADEVLHEDDLPAIRQWCERYQGDERVEGMLFDYYHFWGDYQHHLDAHGTCRREIRIVRNGIGAYSYLDAVSFRRPPDQKLRVVRVPAHVYHYGYVRPPALMAVKKRVQDAIHDGCELTPQQAAAAPQRPFDFGPLGRLPRFSGTHPAVMKEFIARLDWADQLDHGTALARRPIHKHERARYRLLSWLERTFTDREEWIGWRNYRLVRPWSRLLGASLTSPRRGLE